MDKFVQVPHGSVRGEYFESASIRLSLEELSQRFTIDWWHYEDDGLIGATLRASNGHYFAIGLRVHNRARGRNNLGILTLCQSPDEADTLDTALCDLGLTLADTLWVREDLRFTPRELIRQDDHGNQYQVGIYRCRADAEAELRKLAWGSHKQDYWIRYYEPPPRPLWQPSPEWQEQLNMSGGLAKPQLRSMSAAPLV